MGRYKRYIRNKAAYSDGEYVYKSQFERRVAEQIRKVDGCVKYEPYSISYTVPAKVKKYKLDFELKAGTLVEAKGVFELEDRQKQLYLKEQYPDAQIHLLFQNANLPLKKGAKTTLGEWATKHGFTWAEGQIPDEWFKAKPK